MVCDSRLLILMSYCVADCLALAVDRLNKKQFFMRMMIVGAWRWPIYEDAFSRGLVANGAEVYPFETASFFEGLLGRQQSALPMPGPALWRLNLKVIQEAKRVRPDWILFWRSTHILSSTLKHLAAQGIKLVSYNNDDPFGPRRHGRVPWHHHVLWRNYLACLPWFDRNYFYRQVNCDEALEFGARNASLLLPYFIPWRDKPVELKSEDNKEYETDTVFVGHYENDGRVVALRGLHESGLKVRLWGGDYWTREVLGKLYGELAPIRPAEGDEYAKVLSGAKICLAFLSKLNRDTYTRRCFEIPACKSVMLAERTQDLKRFFKEDEEACFFSSTDELIDKAKWLLSHEKKRESIANLGMRRVWTDGHDVVSRAKQFLDCLIP